MKHTDVYPSVSFTGVELKLGMVVPESYQSFTFSHDQNSSLKQSSFISELDFL